MEDKHRKAIQNNFTSLIEQTDLDTMVAGLFEKGVFSEPMTEPYKDANKDARARKRMLYRDIERRGPHAFQNLIDVLTENGHWDLVRALDPDSNLHLHRPGPSVHNRPQFHSLKKDPKAPENEDGAAKPPTPPPQMPPPPPPPASTINLDRKTEIINVIKSKEFMQPTDKNLPLYKTRGRNRGVLVAFSFIEFKDNIEEYRRGADEDCKNLKYLFDQCGFKTLIYNNLRKYETEETLEGLKLVPELRKCECVFIVISSHGYARSNTSDTDFRCSDGKLMSTEDIIRRFNNKHFPSLRGVPKVFIFQVCRGTSEEYVYDTAVDGSPIDPQETSERSKSPYHDGKRRFGRSYSDILIAHSTLPGFVSRRDPEHGSWYIQSLCEVFAAHAHNCHVEQLFRKVDVALERRFGNQTSSIENRGFNNLLYLHPGLYEE